MGDRGDNGKSNEERMELKFLAAAVVESSCAGGDSFSGTTLAGRERRKRGKPKSAAKRKCSAVEVAKTAKRSRGGSVVRGAISEEEKESYRAVGLDRLKQIFDAVDFEEAVDIAAVAKAVAPLKNSVNEGTEQGIRDEKDDGGKRKRRREDEVAEEGEAGGGGEMSGEGKKRRKEKKAGEAEDKGEKDSRTAKATKGNRSSEPDDKRAEEEKINEDRLERTVFVGNVPLGTAHRALAKALDITKTEYETIYFRSIGLEPKFSNNRRNGVLSGNFGDVLQTHNAYVVLRDASLVDTVAGKNRVTLNDHILRVLPAKGRKFSKYDRPRTVFVGNLPLRATENELFHAFRDCGAPSACRIIRDSATGFGKGFGFVCFDEKKCAKAAVRRSNQIELQGRLLRVSMAVGAAEAKTEKDKRLRQLATKREKARERLGNVHPAKRRIAKTKN